jgi:hypothetical protein
MNQVSNAGTVDSRLAWLYKISGTAALIAGILLLIAMIGLIITVLQPGATNGWLSPLQNNWLMVIFKLLAGFGGDQIGLLHILNFLDIAILALVGTMYVGTMYLGLHAVLRRNSIIWLLIAATQPVTGIVLFVATKTTGRTGALGAVLIVSAVMLQSHIFKKVTAYMGILAGVLLGVGDLSVALIPPLMPPIIILATLVGIGYMLLMTWFFLIAYRLFQPESGRLKKQAS